MGKVSLSLSAVRQILSAKATGFKPGEEDQMIKKIEETARRFDTSGKGEMSDREVFNVLKMLKVDCKQEEVRHCSICG